MQDKLNKIIQADCLDYLAELEDSAVDMILIDPPYGVNFKNDFYNDDKYFVQSESVKWLSELYRVLKNNSHCYIFTGTKSLNLWLTNVENSEFEFKNILHIPSYCNGQYLKNNFCFRTEHILYLAKGKGRDFNEVDFIKTSQAWLKDQRNTKKKEYTYLYPNFWDFIFANEKSNTKKNLHPNQKNVKLLEILIQLSTNKDDIVLDCFAGSGSTLLAAKNTNRRYMGCEKDEGYFRIAFDRLNNHNLFDF
jgi:site-specific DNA-methyltransferase (adenine-specific)